MRGAGAKKAAGFSGGQTKNLVRHAQGSMGKCLRYRGSERVYLEPSVEISTPLVAPSALLMLP